MDVKRTFVNMYLATVVFVNTVGFAWAGTESLSPSLHWQKFSLEGQLEEKISQVLRISVPDYQILVKVLVKAKGRDVVKKVNERQKFFDALNNSQGEEQKKLEEDIILRKLDITKYDFAPAEEELEQVQLPPDLLEGIQDIDVFLYFPKEAPKELREDISKLITQLFEKKFNRNFNVVAADNPYANHAKGKKEAKAPPTFEEQFKPYFIPAAVIFAVLIFGLILILLLGRLKQVSNDVSNALRDVGQNITQSLAPEAKEEEVKEVTTTTTAEAMAIAAEAANMQQISFQKFLGVKRFKKLLDKDFDEANLLVNRWLKSGKEADSNMVHLLIKSLDDAEVKSITDKMPVSQLQKMQKAMSAPLREKDIGTVDKMIELTIMDLMLDTKPKLSFAVKDFISTLNSDAGAEAAKEFPEFGALLFHYFPQNMMKDMAMKMEEELLTMCLKFSSEFNKEYLMKHGAEIENYVTEKSKAKNNSGDMPILQIIPNILSSATLEKEEYLLKQLQHLSSWDDFVNVAFDILPSSFLMTFAEEIPKKAFGSLPIKTKARMVVSKPEQVSWTLEDWVGAKGSKTREVLELELNELQGDEKLMNDAKANGQKSWKDFFQKMRTVIKSNNDIQKQVKTSFDEWVQSHFNANESLQSSAPVADDKKEAA